MIDCVVKSVGGCDGKSYLRNGFFLGARDSRRGSKKGKLADQKFHEIQQILFGHNRCHAKAIGIKTAHVIFEYDRVA